MNERTFLKEFAKSPERDELIARTYDVFMRFADKENLTEDDVSTDEIEQLAKGFVDRGLGAESVGGDWQQ